MLKSRRRRRDFIARIARWLSWEGLPNWMQGLGVNMTVEMRDLKVRADLCAAAEQKFGHAFGSLEQLLEFLLREVLRDDSAAADQAEDRLVEQRLRELGYL